MIFESINQAELLSGPNGLPSTPLLSRLAKLGAARAWD